MTQKHAAWTYKLLELVFSGTVQQNTYCHTIKLDVLSKKSIAQSLSASIISGHKLHMSSEIVGEKNVIYETISRTSS